MPVAPPGPEARVYEPVELNRELRVHLEAGFPRLWLSGELSNLAQPASGHWYFTIKDARAQVRCALFRGSRGNVSGEPANGERVLVRGRISLYEARGDCQLIADAMLPAGSGDLQQAFEALKRKLEAEGLFAAERKRPLPGYPAAVAVVTSRSGAAVRDVLATLRRRWPAARVRLYATPVQGDRAVPGLIAALERVERDAAAPVVILARGGGSIEDLWAFNDESLARRIASMPIPVVSGVGHETDFTIADFVADLRAATPTAAAEAVTPDGPALKRAIDDFDRRRVSAQTRRLEQYWQRIDSLARRLCAGHPARRLNEARGRLDAIARRALQAVRTGVSNGATRLGALDQRLTARRPGRTIAELRKSLSAADARLLRAAGGRVQSDQARLAAAARALDHVSPLAILARGYALIEDGNGRILSRRGDFAVGQTIRTRVRDLRIESTIEQIEAAASPAGDPGPK